jgi:hypothetical protein
MAKYREFLKTKLGRCWREMPSAPEACLVLSSLRSAIEEESGMPRDDGVLFQYAILALPDAIAEWRSTRVAAIDQLISVHNAGKGAHDLANPEQIVFNCCHRHCVGPKEALAHHCSGAHYDDIRKQWKLYTGKALGIDARRTRELRSLMMQTKADTVSDLESLDPRVVCMSCSVDYKDQVSGRPAMTWRQCVGLVHLSMVISNLLSAAHSHGSPLHLWERPSHVARSRAAGDCGDPN